MSKVVIWKMDEPRRTECRWAVLRPCSCGCDRRGGDHGVGYLRVNDSDGNGVTIWIESEEAFRILESAMP